MLRIWVLFAFVVAVSSSTYKLQEIDGNFRLYHGQRQFAMSMLNVLTKSNPESFFFSPHSTYRALILAYMGAEGRTKENLRASMFLDWANDKTNVMSAYKLESIARSARFADKSIQFNSADKLYVTQNAQLK